jgi:hypothetical protein
MISGLLAVLTHLNRIDCNRCNRLLHEKYKESSNISLSQIKLQISLWYPDTLADVAGDRPDCIAIKYVIHNILILASDSKNRSSCKSDQIGEEEAMRPFFRHVLILTMALLIYYAVTFIIVYTTIMSQSVKSAIISDGGNPANQVGASISALFPFPAILWLIGVILGKWIAF